VLKLLCATAYEGVRPKAAARRPIRWTYPEVVLRGASYLVAASVISLERSFESAKAEGGIAQREVVWRLNSSLVKSINFEWRLSGGAPSR
jgi:hypothetical protein